MVGGEKLKLSLQGDWRAVIVRREFFQRRAFKDARVRQTREALVRRTAKLLESSLE